MAHGLAQMKLLALCVRDNVAVNVFAMSHHYSRQKLTTLLSGFLLLRGGDMPKDLTVTALAMWGLFALGVIVGTCYCYYSDNHLDEKLGVSKGKIKLNTTIISGVFLFP